MEVTSGPCSGVAEIEYKKSNKSYGNSTTKRFTLIGHTAEVRADVEYHEKGRKEVNCPRKEGDYCIACRSVINERINDLICLLPHKQQEAVKNGTERKLVQTRCVFK